MPRLTQWMVRTALMYLGVGVTLGALILLHKGWSFWPDVWRLLSMHIEFVLIGWTAQLAAGVAFWILPRYAQGAPRGDERPVWVAYGLLNLGVLAVGVSRWLGGLDAMVLLGHAAEALAALVFILHAWPRVKPLGK